MVTTVTWAAWPQFKEAFETRRDSYAGITNTAVGGRLAAYVASLDLAQSVCETLGVPAPSSDPIEFLIQAVRDGANDADRARDAFLCSASWAAMNRHRFWGSRAAIARGTGMPGNGWVGRWEDGNTEWSHICIEANALRGILDRHGFIYEEVVHRWGLRRDIYEDIVCSERPDIEKIDIADAQLDLIEATVRFSDASWSALAQGE